VEGEIFRTRPDRPWGPPSLLCNGHRVFHGGKAAVAWRWPPTPSNAKVEGRVQLYISSPSGPSWSVLRWTLPLPLTFIYYIPIIKRIQHSFFKIPTWLQVSARSSHPQL